jgi:hypothetical protein
VARDITEGRAERAIAVDVGVVSTTNTWQNTDIAYDVAIGGLPFIYAINDARPYIRQTAPFRKDQFDNGQEPGEQSLTGWWIRSQSSFHTVVLVLNSMTQQLLMKQDTIAIQIARASMSGLKDK